MIVSIDAERAFDEIWHQLMIKTLSTVGIEETYLNIIKVVFDKPTTNIILKKQKTESVSMKIRNRTGMTAFTTLIQKVLDILAIAIRQEEEIKGI